MLTACVSNDKDMSENRELIIGDPAPLFSLPDQDGKIFDLATHLGGGPLVIYFYPKDESYGCTKEACSFRDSYGEFLRHGVEVVGISADDEESHRSFAAHHRLPFPLLSDPGRKVARMYGVGKSLGLFPGRVTFVIDGRGIIRGKFSSQAKYDQHVEEALKIISTL